MAFDFNSPASNSEGGAQWDASLSVHVRPAALGDPHCLEPMWGDSTRDNMTSLSPAARGSCSVGDGELLTLVPPAASSPAAAAAAKQPQAPARDAPARDAPRSPPNADTSSASTSACSGR